MERANLPHMDQRLPEELVVNGTGTAIGERNSPEVTSIVDIVSVSSFILNDHIQNRRNCIYKKSFYQEDRSTGSRVRVTLRYAWAIEHGDHIC